MEKEDAGEPWFAALAWFFPDGLRLGVVARRKARSRDGMLM